MNEAENTLGTERKAPQLNPYKWKPGQSGNPGGRPKKPLKEYSMAQFESWTDEQKEAFLKSIPAIDRWKMTEGNPDTKTELESTNVEISISGADLLLAQQLRDQRLKESN